MPALSKDPHLASSELPAPPSPGNQNGSPGSWAIWSWSSPNRDTNTVILAITAGALPGRQQMTKSSAQFTRFLGLTRLHPVLVTSPLDPASSPRLYDAPCTHKTA